MFERYTSKLLLSPKTQIGEYVFDVYVSISHNLTATVTNHPVQMGASISDHKFDEPDELTFQIGMSDASQDLVKGQFSNFGGNITDVKDYLSLAFESAREKNWALAKGSLIMAKRKAWGLLTESRSVNAFSKLVQLKILGVPLTCVTRLHTYNNMVITSITTEDTIETKYGLRATVTMREVISPELQQIQVNSTATPHAQITQSTNSGSEGVFNLDVSKVPPNASTDYIEYVMNGGGSQI